MTDLKTTHHPNCGVNLARPCNCAQNEIERLKGAIMEHYGEIFPSPHKHEASVNRLYNAAFKWMSNRSVCEAPDD